MARMLSLQARNNGDIWMSLWASINDEGDFVIEGHDLGPGDSEYEWITVVRAEHIPALITLLGGNADDDLLDIVERDWKPVEGAGLERRIRESEIPNELEVWRH